MYDLLLTVDHFGHYCVCAYSRNVTDRAQYAL